MSDTSKPSGASGNDYLKNLFAQEQAAPIISDESDIVTQNPAMTAGSITDLLAMTDLEFLTPYLHQGATHLELPHGVGAYEDILLCEYQCPDKISAGELDEDCGESFGVDIAVPNHMSAGITIMFNEDTALYQLDSIYLQLDDEPVIDIDCNSGNDTEIYNFRRCFSLLAKKIVNREMVSSANLDLMRQFYDGPVNQQPQSPAP